MASTSGASCGVYTREIWLQWIAHAIKAWGEISYHNIRSFHPVNAESWPVEVFSISWPPYCNCLWVRNLYSLNFFFNRCIEHKIPWRYARENNWKAACGLRWLNPKLLLIVEYGMIFLAIKCILTFKLIHTPASAFS